MRYLVNTPNGHIGSRLVEKLREHKHDVSVIVRDAQKAKKWTDQGLTATVGSIEDAAVIEKAIQGVDAFFWLTPPDYRPGFVAWIKQVSRQAAQIIKKAGVRRGVMLSSVGAQHGPGVGPISALHEAELAFSESIPDLTIIRAGTFMENLFTMVQPIQKMGSIFQPMPADVAFPFIATRDIADMAARILTDPPRKGRNIVGAHGPTDLTWNQIAAIVSQGLNRPVKYVQVPFDAVRQGMIGAGLPDFVADLLIEMLQAANQGKLKPAEPRTAETTTPTSLSEFVRSDLAPKISPN